MLAGMCLIRFSYRCFKSREMPVVLLSCCIHQPIIFSRVFPEAILEVWLALTIHPLKAFTLTQPPALHLPLPPIISLCSRRQRAVPLVLISWVLVAHITQLTGGIRLLIIIPPTMVRLGFMAAGVNLPSPPPPFPNRRLKRCRASAVSCSWVSVTGEILLFADEMQRDAARMRAHAVFPQINPLPCSERRASGADGQAQIHRCQRGADVRGHVIVALRRMDK